jgi:porin
MALLATDSALAQSDARSATARASQRQIEVGDATQPEHALGDWAGLRTRLNDRGVDLSLGYLTEIADVTSGGLRHGIDYAHQIKLQADLDGGKLLGIRGASLHTVLVNRAGRNASADYLGDDLFQVQEIYGGTNNAIVSIVYLYGEQLLFDGAVDVKAGRMNVGQDFASSPLYCQYLSLGLCPEPRSLTLDSGFTIYPNSTWGTRGRVQAKDLYAALGVYQARPRFGGPTGFDWGFSHTTGVEVPAEIGWEPRIGSDQLQGHYKVGVAFNTSDTRDPLTLRNHGHRTSWYVLVDQMVRRTGKSGTDGVILLAGWAHADSKTSVLSDFAFAGLSARGVVHGRPADTVELLVSHGSVSHRVTIAQRLAQGAGLPLPSGFPSAPGSFAAAATPPDVQTGEWVIEANYGLKVQPGVTVVPDMQFVGRPAAARSIPDALVLAGRLEVNF